MKLNWYRWVRPFTCLWLLSVLPQVDGATLLTQFSFPAGPTYPYSGLIQGSDGNFYGTTVSGGAHGGNVEFRPSQHGRFVPTPAR